MNQSIKILTFIIFALSTTQLLAQLDNSRGNKKNGEIKAVVKNNAKIAEKPKSIELNGSDGFKSAFDKEQEKYKNKQAEQSINNKGIITQEKLSEERFLKAFKKINGQYIYPKIDQDLGSFRTNSKSVNIICRDFQYPDGDRVTIFVNDIPVISNIILKQNYQKFTLPLEVGINKIAFKALNQGSSGPNTAAFKVYNDAGMLLSSNEWNLATGAKATLVIAKDK
ncbi:hypothetical protein BTO04_14465 [Polaribacter sp. SA4-10]|uniref:hypothetical protein n=1 Tax=Polaribacter sp. SA4-10 TaxID=754397 RepID=UPI000B3BF303|nr:hypothetical protein [Polaribacter sp. SA4-10]ARV07825.1 hypothetical protein BTO04_14465 [Polaribacter sp. SA4-10]